MLNNLIVYFFFVIAKYTTAAWKIIANAIATNSASLVLKRGDKNIMRNPRRKMIIKVEIRCKISLVLSDIFNSSYEPRREVV